MSGAAAWSLQLTTALGEDALVLQSLDGEEAVSQPFHFQLTASAGDITTDGARVVGKPACVTLVDGDGAKRYINGVATRFTLGPATCVIDLRPWFWLQSLTRNNRIFQDMTVPDILAKVFAGYGGAAFRNDLVMSYDKLEFCVQYGESDFHFASRLMEEWGISYYFDHSDSAHTLVLVDDPARFPACANIGDLPLLTLGEQRDWLTGNRIEAVSFSQSVAAGAYKATDYNFVTPATSLVATAGEGDATVYDYPGYYTLKADGEAVAKRRVEALTARAAELSGVSPVRHLVAGGTFTLARHPNEALNQKYILLSVRHRAARREYDNTFTAIPAKVAFRPGRDTPRPKIAGSQTAVVVGPSGKEIWTDEYGRIKVQFHWDQIGQNNETSSCWIRVAQNWAGAGWGGFALPRIGQEVVVSFLEGDPDRPLVTGCVYNGANTVPYALPDGQDRSTLKSRSTPSADGFNEIRLDDKAGSEELFIQAQKDLNVTVLNNSATTVKSDHGLTVQEGNSTITVSKGNLTIEVTGNVSIKASGTMSLEATGALTIKGATVEITASASGTFDGGGMLNLKGGLVKLN